MNNDNLAPTGDAYEIGPEKIIDTYAEATRHVDRTVADPVLPRYRHHPRYQQGANLRRKKGIKTLYYIRLRQLALEGTEIEGCVSCAL